jgi:hypothetical protein
VKLVGERVDNPAWPEAADAVQPLVRVCIECHEEFGRRMASGRLRSPRRWRRALFCSRACCAQHRRWKASPKLTGHLAGLDPAPAAPPPKPKMRAVAHAGNAPGRPSTVTGPRAVAKAGRVAFVMSARFAVIRSVRSA